MGKEAFGYAAVLLLLSISGGVTASRPEPQMLQQETVGAGHWHKYESLFWLYPNTDLDALNPTQRDAGYFGIKRRNVRINSAYDQSIFKLRIHADGIPSLNDGNITLCHPTTHRVTAPSFLPLRTAAELEYHTLYHNEITLLDNSALLDAKLSLEHTLRHINHCSSPKQNNVPWGIMEAHPETGRLAPIVTSAVSNAQFRDARGMSVNAKVLHVFLSHSGEYSSEPEVDAAFDVLYTMDPEPRIRFVNVPGEDLANDSEGKNPDWANIIREAGNPLLGLLEKARVEAEDKMADDLELNEAEERKETPTPSSHRDDTQRKQRLADIASALQVASTGTDASQKDTQVNTSTSTTPTPTPTPAPGKSRITITFIPVPVRPSTIHQQITAVMSKFTKTTPLEALHRIRLSPPSSSATKSSETEDIPGAPGPGAIALVLWSLFWVMWAFCMGLYTCRIIRYVIWKVRGSPPSYQRVRLDEEDCERGVIVLSPDYFAVGLDSPDEDRQSYRKPMLSSISEKSEPEDEE